MQLPACEPSTVKIDHNQNQLPIIKLFAFSEKFTCLSISKNRLFCMSNIHRRTFFLQFATPCPSTAAVVTPRCLAAPYCIGKDCFVDRKIFLLVCRIRANVNAQFFATCKLSCCYLLTLHCFQSNGNSQHGSGKQTQM